MQLSEHLSKEELQRMKQADIQEAVPSQLADINEINLDMNPSVPDRAAEYIREAGNPFLVRAGEYVVKIGYSDCAETFNDRMKQYIDKMAEIKYE